MQRLKQLLEQWRSNHKAYVEACSVLAAAESEARDFMRHNPDGRELSSNESLAVVFPQLIWNLRQEPELHEGARTLWRVVQDSARATTDAGEKLNAAERALAEESGRLDNAHLDALVARRQDMLNQAILAFTPFVSSPAKANELALCCDRISGLDFQITCWRTRRRSAEELAESLLQLTD